MLRKVQIASLVLIVGITCVPMTVSSADVDLGRFLGNWALFLPGGAGWLNIRQEEGTGLKYLDGDLLWYGGSVNPVGCVSYSGDSETVVVTQYDRIILKKDAQGKPTKQRMAAHNLLIHVDGDNLKGTMFHQNESGLIVSTEVTGKRIPPPPPAPDLSKVQYGDWIPLFDGKDKVGWKLTDEKATDGWFVKDGLLNNDPKQTPGKHISYSNLQTVKEFEDFNLSLEVKVGKNENSGVYLRGIYEVQVEDSYGQSLDSHHMGGIYSRITPTVNAEKPAGEWQSMDITLCDRHVTVILNGKKIIDNQPVLGCTGGALSADEFKPGPIYLQGDHTGIAYRNIKIRPIVKK